VLLLAALLLGSVWFLRTEEANLRRAVEYELEAVTTMQAQAIARWCQERRSDAKMIQATPYSVRRALDALAQPDSGTTRTMFTVWLDRLMARDAYVRALVLDEHQEVKIVHPPQASRALCEEMRRGIDLAFGSREVVMTDLHLPPKADGLHLGLLVPLVARSEEGGVRVPAAGRTPTPADKSLGVLVLELDARVPLAPLHAAWPAKRLTAESLLVRREGETALLIKSLTDETNRLLVLRLPLQRTNLVAVQAALGKEGVVWGQNDRGVDTVGFIHAVPGVSWRSVTHLDKAVAFAGWRVHLKLIVALVVSGVAVVGTSTTLLWQRARRRHYEALYESEVRFRESARLLKIAGHAARLGGWSVDLVGSRVRWSEDVAAIHEAPVGYSPSVDEGIAFYAPEWQNRIREVFRKCAQDGVAYDEEMQIITARGNRRWVRTLGEAVRDATGKIVRVQGAFQDITPRKTAEEARRQQDYILAESQRIAHVGSWSLQSDGRLIWSAEAYRLFGVVPEAFTPSLDAFFGLAHPEDREALRAWITEARVCSPARDLEFRCLRPDGVIRILSMRGELAPETDASGTSLACIVQDITDGRHSQAQTQRLVTQLADSQQVMLSVIEDLRRTADSLRESRGLLADVIEHSAALIFTKDREGRYQLVNRRWEEVHRLVRAEAMGKRDEDLFPEALAHLLRADDQAVWDGGSVAEHEEAWETATGPRWFLCVKFAIHRQEGKVNALCGMATEITVRKQDEAALQHSEEQFRRLNEELEQRIATRTAQLEAVNRELEAFAYSVSHDLRAPLRHVQGYAELLARALGDLIPDEARRYVGHITDSSREMGVLIDDLLAFSRMGRAEMTDQKTDLNVLVGEVLCVLEPQTKGRSLEWDIAPLPAVRADPAMMRLVLQNLLSNAVKFTRPRHPARVTIRCAGEDDGLLVFSVRDNGVGFDPRYAGKLFGVFQRLHRADEFEGTGIGLANVQRMIARQGGRTWAEGELGQGATFYFTLRPADPEGTELTKRE
jgi:PAS domain S-box-containing protein